MVTLPKRCRDSALSPWLLTNLPALFDFSASAPSKRLVGDWASSQTCLSCLYWTQDRGWVCFKSVIGQKHLTAVLRSLILTTYVYFTPLEDIRAHFMSNVLDRSITFTPFIVIFSKSELSVRKKF